MATLTFSGCKPSNSVPRRGILLRWLDTLAELQMRHSLSLINRTQADSATMTGVIQPSSANERCSTNP